MRANTMTVRMDQRALIENWSAHTVIAHGGHNDGWPIIAGLIYGDPRCAEGAAITVYGVVSADEQTLCGIDMDYALGRKAGGQP